ncbi:MAG TPA: RNA-binding domain-containing protein [Candidatus Thermoplasmatota archaeon]|nr:RNA-binding domain-containing protein [Candidatus Thermoplasmatota archaeon]
MPLRVTARAAVHPTEDPAKVRAAVANLFPSTAIEVGPTEVVARGTDLTRLAELVRDHQIPDSARGQMLNGLRTSADTSKWSEGAAKRFARFPLGKQAAFVGKPHFGAPETALGNIDVLVEADDEEAVLRAIYAAAPDTTVAPALAAVPRELRPVE